MTTYEMVDPGHRKVLIALEDSEVPDGARIVSVSDQEIVVSYFDFPNKSTFYWTFNNPGLDDRYREWQIFSITPVFRLRKKKIEIKHEK